MDTLIWEEKYSVNIREIDRQHKTIVRLINELNDFAKQESSDAIVGKVLYELVRYTAYHFSFEEKLLVQYKYPDFKQHFSKHNALIEQLKVLMIENEKEDHVLPKDLILFLSNWLILHIMGDDKKYSVFINNNGVT